MLGSDDCTVLRNGAGKLKDLATLKYTREMTGKPCGTKRNYGFVDSLKCEEIGEVKSTLSFSK